MRKIILLLIICLFIIGAKIELLNLHQHRSDAKESLNLLQSAGVTLEIPIAANMTWKDMLRR